MSIETIAAATLGMFVGWAVALFVRLVRDTLIPDTPDIGPGADLSNVVPMNADCPECEAPLRTTVGFCEYCGWPATEAARNG